jgi:DNA-directed RNA polymerase specialized sigma24 family protein
MAVRAEPAAVDDLFQDVWTIFYNRWTRWRFSPELEAPQARPVLSFLLRTSHLTLKAHRRYRQHRAHPPLGDVEVDDRLRASESLFHRVEARRCLAVARRVCPDDEMDVLLGKLAGLSAREIALSLAVTESVVDHGYRTAVGRIRRELGLREGQSRSARPRRSKKRKGKTHV